MGGVGFGHGLGAIGYVRTTHHVPVATTHHVATTRHVPVVKTHHVAETHHVSAAPRCKHTPMRECTPRRVEHPRKVCMTTTVTEEHTSTVVDESSQLIKSGEPKDPESLPKSYSRAIYKREADAEASRYVSTYHRPAVGSAPITKVSTPDCTTTPVKSCERNPKTKQRNVFRTVCDTVVDV